MNRRQIALCKVNFVLGAACTTMAPGWALAAETQGTLRTVAIWADGPSHEAVRQRAVASLGDSYVSGGAVEFASALQRQGHKAALTQRPQSSEGRAALGLTVSLAARAAHVDEVLILHVEKQGHALKIHVVAVDATTGKASLTEAPFTRRGDGLAELMLRELEDVRTASAESAPAAAVESPAQVVAPGVAPVVTPPSDSTSPVTDPAPRLAGPARDEPSASSPRKVGDVSHALWQLSAGGELGARHFQYTDGLSKNLRSYQLPAAPLAAVEAEAYPLAAAAAPGLGDLGIIGGYASAFALQSAPSSGGQVETSWARFYAGARFRIRSGGGRAPVLGASGVYGGETFALSSTANQSDLPSVAYRFVGVYGDARVPLGPAALTARGGYLFVLSAGDVATRFPRASVGGIEAELEASMKIALGFEARVTASYRRFFYSMNPVPGDGYVAGGALDELEGLRGSVAYVY